MSAQMIPDSLSITLGQQQIPDCLRTVIHFGHNSMVNVCTGETLAIGWGLGSWAVAVIAFAGVVGAVIAIIGMALTFAHTIQ